MESPAGLPAVSRTLGFDSVGYAAGENPLPDVPAVLRVRPGGSDDTALLQAAIDELASQSRATTNFRGTLELLPGTFHVEGRLRVAASGIVLRGSANGRYPTRIVAIAKSRRTLLEIGAGILPSLGERTEISAGVVPAGSRMFSVAKIGGLEVGDRIVVQRPSTEAWIASLGMNQSAGPFSNLRTHWLPGSRDLFWNRVITAIDPCGKTITLDAPITTTLERRYGGGTVAKVVAGAPILQVGIENLIFESECDPLNAKDEEHAWIAIALDHVEDAWVRRVTARHFAGSAVRVGAYARRVTVQDCHNEKPVSELGGYRRQSFLVYGGQVLVQRCTAEEGLNDFAVGFCAAGPNVFRDCEARAALGPSGAFESWASGVLYERVRIQGAGLRLTRDDAWTQGAGWTSANSAAVNCNAAEIVVQGPEGSGNVVVRGAGGVEAPSGAGQTVIADNEELCASEAPLFASPQASASRSVAKPLPRLEIVNGRFAINARAVWGGQVNGGWWLGQLSPLAARDAGVSITRFAPGRHGTGLTEDLSALAERMQREGMRFYGGGPGLWYDRRRDDHSVAARADGNVWAPFFEMPWARSGQGMAWDGLSRYDLAKFNPWYFERTREFARLCEQHGLVLYHNLYNTHNLLESPSHWVDFPWRPANCINESGLPDSPPLDAGDGIHLANQFYNVDHAERRVLHRAYIRHTLDRLGSSPNVIFSVAHQFAGPLAFQEFFLDTVAGWERETGSRIKVALVTSKDITDAILGDPVRTGQIAVVDMRYWQTQPDGTVWAPRGDRNRAFREMTGEQFGPKYGDIPPPTTPWHVYRQVRQYRDRFPAKALVAWNGGAGPLPIFMAGSAQVLMRNPASGQSQGIESDQTPFDAFVRDHLAETLMNLLPRDNWLMDPKDNWCLADPDGKVILLYSLIGPQMTLARKFPASHYTGIWFNPRAGHSQSADLRQSWRPGDGVVKPTGDDWLLLLRATPG
jgi:hypothetical protein